MQITALAFTGDFTFRKASIGLIFRNKLNVPNLLIQTTGPST